VKVPLVRPQLSDVEADAAARVVRSGWLTQGPEVAGFEAELAAAVGAPHAVAVANCTVALELALRCLGVGPGDEVATVSHSFIATANVVVAVGATPVFVDVEAATFGMDPRLLDAALTPRTKAILCVHQIGLPCDLPAILAIAAARGIPVIEDAACAIGSELELDGRWQRIGRPHGAIACFSFHPRKVVTTGDGGMLTTADPAIDRRARLLRQHAMSVSDAVRHGSAQVVIEDYLEPAYNYRMTDLQAAVGRPQLARLDAIIAERRRLAARYAAAFADARAVAVPVERPGTRSNWQSYPLTLRAGIDQRAALQALLDRGIACKPGISNAHREPAYADTSRWRGGPLPVSERLRDTTILVPLFHGMTEAEQDAVIAAVRGLDEEVRS
jgi:perosamine synthetase